MQCQVLQIVGTRRYKARPGVSGVTVTARGVTRARTASALADVRTSAWCRSGEEVEAIAAPTPRALKTG